MNSKNIERRIDGLNERLRILILQNAHEETYYDERFLKEIRGLADQILLLKRTFLKKNNSLVRPFPRQAMAKI